MKDLLPIGSVVTLKEGDKEINDHGASSTKYEDKKTL